MEGQVDLSKTNALNCRCLTCEHFIHVREVQHKITPFKGIVGKVLVNRCYCWKYNVGLPLITDEGSVKYPNVKECGYYKKYC